MLTTDKIDNTVESRYDKHYYYLFILFYFTLLP